MSHLSETNQIETPNQDEKVKPLLMYEYLQQLGDRQKQAIEQFYHSALEKPCGGTIKCEDSFGGIGYLGCSFLSPKHHHFTADDPHDPFNPNIVGPKSCEYCHAETTLECDPKTCDRPKLFFSKKEPPFSGYDYVRRDSKGKRRAV